MKLYILDLDNCLIYTSYQEIEGLNLISKRKWHYLYHRPELLEFLKFAQKTADIAFYTSSKSDYAKWIVSSFNLEKQHLLFSRKYCKKRRTNYGDIYYKSIGFLPIKKKYKKIIVLDDRIDLWDDKGVELHDIEPYMGDFFDTELQTELQDWLIKLLKKQPRIS